MKNQMIACATLVCALASAPAFAQGDACSGLPDHAQLKAALDKRVPRQTADSISTCGALSSTATA